MNHLLSWLDSASWVVLMQALGHTLWLGAGAAVALFIGLRRSADPFVRYRQSVTALALILIGGLVAWAILREAPRHRPGAVRVPQGLEISSRAGSTGPTAKPENVLSRASIGTAPAPMARHSAWLAFLWLTGAGLMLGRTVWLVRRAEQLRRSARRLENGPLPELVATARRELGVGRSIGVVVTERLTSPAVVGILVPTLIFPLSLIITFSLGQLRLIVLHEVAHIRRGDYLVNLLQLVTEALLFFNPGVWWISRQIRQEREACCDALAIRLAGEPVAYARALAAVAEIGVASRLAAAPAFGDGGKATGLKERVQRLLIPGYRPATGLSWQALGGSFILGSALLLVSALGAQWTVHAAAKLLTPKERIERIEAAMTAWGQPAEAAPSEEDTIEVRARIRAGDGAPLSSRASALFSVCNQNRGYVTACDRDESGLFVATLPRGTLYFAASVEGFAPGLIGPLDTSRSNHLGVLELTLDRGFTMMLQARDDDTGDPLSGAQFKARHWIPGWGHSIFNPSILNTDEGGLATLSNCAPLSLSVVLETPEYETVEKRIDSPKPGRVEIRTRRALTTAGAVWDAAAGKPLGGVGIYVLKAEGVSGLATTDPRRPSSPIATTDDQGQFVIRELPRQGRFALLVDFPGYSQALLTEVRAGQTNLQARLGPELPVRGRIAGELTQLARNAGQPAISVSARNADGSPAHDVLFSVLELKKAPDTNSQWSRTPGGNSFSSGEGPRRYVATPLPLGGTYQIVAHRNNSFAVGQPITLTEAAPDAAVEIQLSAGTNVLGQVVGPNGEAVADAKPEGVLQLLEGHSFGLQPYTAYRVFVDGANLANPILRPGNAKPAVLEVTLPGYPGLR